VIVGLAPSVQAAERDAVAFRNCQAVVPTFDHRLQAGCRFEIVDDVR
jgi:hypothetical protein